jgi:hypothetical protein
VFNHVLRLETGMSFNFWDPSSTLPLLHALSRHAPRTPRVRASCALVPGLVGSLFQAVLRFGSEETATALLVAAVERHGQLLGDETPPPATGDDPARSAGIFGDGGYSTEPTGANSGAGVPVGELFVNPPSVPWSAPVLRRLTEGVVALLHRWPTLLGTARGPLLTAVSHTAAPGCGGLAAQICWAAGELLRPPVSTARLVNDYEEALELLTYECIAAARVAEKTRRLDEQERRAAGEVAAAGVSAVSTAAAAAAAAAAATSSSSSSSSPSGQQRGGGGGSGDSRSWAALVAVTDPDTVAPPLPRRAPAAAAAAAAAAAGHHSLLDADPTVYSAGPQFPPARAGADDVTTTRLLLLLISAMAKLSTRSRAVSQRAALCLAKIQKHGALFHPLVVARAEECVRLLATPSIAVRVLAGCGMDVFDDGFQVITDDAPLSLRLEGMQGFDGVARVATHPLATFQLPVGTAGWADRTVAARGSAGMDTDAGQDAELTPMAW